MQHQLAFSITGAKLKALISQRVNELEGEVVKATKLEDAVGPRHYSEGSDHFRRRQRSLAMIADLADPATSYAVTLHDMVVLDLMDVPIR